MNQADGLVQSCLHEGMFLTTQWNERAGPSQASTRQLRRRGGGNGLRHHQISRYPISFYENGMWFTFLVPPGPFIYVNHLYSTSIAPGTAPGLSGGVDVISFWGSWHRSFTSSSLDGGCSATPGCMSSTTIYTVHWQGGGARRKENYLVGIYCAVCPTYYSQIFISQWSEQIEFVCSSVDAMCAAA